MTTLSIQLSNGKVVGVSVKKIKVEVNEPTIIKRDEKGREVFKKRETNFGQIFDKFRWVTVDVEGNKIAPKNVRDYLVQEDGSEILVKPKTKTKIVLFNQDNMFPANYVQLMLPEGIYEVFSNDDEVIRELIEEAEKCFEKDVCYFVDGFTWRKGYKEYFAILQPLKIGNGVLWRLITTRGRIQYQNVMEIKEEEEKAITIKTLPSITKVLGIGG